MASSRAQNVKSCCNFSRALRSIGAIALHRTGWYGGTSAAGATAVGDVDTVAGDAVLRALAALRCSQAVLRRAAQVDGSVSSVFIPGGRQWVRKRGRKGYLGFGLRANGWRAGLVIFGFYRDASCTLARTRRSGGRYRNTFSSRGWAGNFGERATCGSSPYGNVLVVIFFRIGETIAVIVLCWTLALIGLGAWPDLEPGRSGFCERSGSCRTRDGGGYTSKWTKAWTDLLARRYAGRALAKISG
jgi:hypothetical protein